MKLVLVVLVLFWCWCRYVCMISVMVFLLLFFSVWLVVCLVVGNCLLSSCVVISSSWWDVMFGVCVMVFWV